MTKYKVNNMHLIKFNGMRLIARCANQSLLQYCGAMVAEL